MANTASDHIKPCNIGQSEAHNRRTPEYLAHINKDRIYVRLDLMERNESWTAPEAEGMDLQAYHDAIARLVKEKTGRAMQVKERTRIDKKTGKTVKVNGSSPIRESVVVCRADTTMEELKRYCDRCHERWGITAIQIHIHRDEGHCQVPGDKSTWKPNFHAHIVWDWMNHETGKSCKLGREDMSMMQDMVAEALGMERGKPKAETGKVHLERNDYIVAKQKQEARQALTAKAEAETERKRIEAENRDKERRGTELDKEIEEKASRANRESGNAILSGLANLAGRGRYAELEKRNRELEESVPKEKGRLQSLFTNQLKEEVTKRTKEFAEREAGYKRQQEELRRKHDSLTAKYNALLQSGKEAERETASRLKWRDTLLYRLADVLYKAGELFRKIIDAIIDFARSGLGGNGSHGDIFHDDEAAGIKEFMDMYADTEDERIGVGNWLVGYSSIKGRLSEREENRARKEVDDVAKGRYDWRVRQNGDGIRR